MAEWSRTRLEDSHYVKEHLMKLGGIKKEELVQLADVSDVVHMYFTEDGFPERFLTSDGKIFASQYERDRRVDEKGGGSFRTRCENFRYRSFDALRKARRLSYRALFAPELVLNMLSNVPEEGDVEKLNPYWRGFPEPDHAITTQSLRISGKTSDGDKVVVYVHRPNFFSDCEKVLRDLVEWTQNRGFLERGKFDELVKLDGQQGVSVVEYNPDHEVWGYLHFEDVLDHPHLPHLLGIPRGPDEAFVRTLLKVWPSLDEKVFDYGTVDVKNVLDRIEPEELSESIYLDLGRFDDHDADGDYAVARWIYFRPYTKDGSDGRITLPIIGARKFGGDGTFICVPDYHRRERNKERAAPIDAEQLFDRLSIPSTTGLESALLLPAEAGPDADGGEPERDEKEVLDADVVDKE